MELRGAIAVGAALFAVLAAPASGTHAQEGSTPGLEVGIDSAFGRMHVRVQTDASSGLPARAELDIPAGYDLDLSAARGEAVGGAFIALTDAGATSNPGVALTNVDLKVDDPTSYASDPIAQSCAPGAHATLWSGNAALAGQNLRLLVFLDPVQGGGETVVMCPSGPTGTTPVITALTLDLPAPTTAPSTGSYTWRALVTPRSGKVYELRALALLPASVTMTASYDAKHKQAVLTGKAVAGGQPVAHASIQIEAHVGNTSSVDFQPELTTTSDGRFSTRRAIKVTTDYTASVEPAPQACTAPSTAPGGCLSQTVVAPEQAYATVFVRGRHDAVRSYTRAGQALAASELPRSSELPAGANAVGPGNHLCDGKHPSEAKLTVTGEAQSPFYLALSRGSGGGTTDFGAVEISATARVFRTAKQATAALDGVATLATARCLLGRGTGTAKKSTAAYPKSPATVRAFVDTIDFQGPTGTMEIVFLQRGRSVAKLIVVGVNTPSRPLALALERSLAARLR